MDPLNESHASSGEGLVVEASIATNIDEGSHGESEILSLRTVLSVIAPSIIFEQDLTDGCIIPLVESCVLSLLDRGAVVDSACVCCYEPR